MSEEIHHSMRRVAIGTLAEQANYWPYVQVRPPAAQLRSYIVNIYECVRAAPSQLLSLTG